jgi:stalled ribosome rescue protein Dom34
MSSFIVYIDHEQAKIFKMSADGVEKAEAHHHVKLNHKNNQDDKKKDPSKFFHDVAKNLNGAGEILVLGHGIAKDQFVHHLKDHHHNDLSKKVVGVETVDKPTDKQILGLARKFFKSAHMFNA